MGPGILGPGLMKILNKGYFGWAFTWDDQTPESQQFRELGFYSDLRVFTWIINMIEMRFLTMDECADDYRKISLLIELLKNNKSVSDPISMKVGPKNRFSMQLKGCWHVQDLTQLRQLHPRHDTATLTMVSLIFYLISLVFELIARFLVLFRWTFHTSCWNVP